MDNTLSADILKAYDSLNEIKFKINDNEYTFYYRYLTILEHTRIKLACTKSHITVHEDGSKTETLSENEHLYPIYIILEKALDKDGKKLYSIKNIDDFQMLNKMPFGLLSQIAAEFQFDITGNINSLSKSE